MITDFVKAKRLLVQLIDERMKQAAYSNAVMVSHAKNIRIYEGDKLGSAQEDGESEIDSLRQIEESISISSEEMENLTMDDFLKKIEEMGAKMGGQMEQGMIEALNNSIEKSGNVITGHKTISEEALLEMTEKLPIDFKDDDREQPIMPNLYVGPEQVPVIKKMMEAQTKEEADEFLRRQNKILDKKHEEYMTELKARKIIE